jgi:predicted TIM-barrel enzyme
LASQKIYTIASATTVILSHSTTGLAVPVADISTIDPSIEDGLVGIGISSNALKTTLVVSNTAILGGVYLAPGI